MKKTNAPIILGGISLITWLIPLIGIVTSIVGIVLSRKNLKLDSCKSYRLGLIFSIIGLVLTLINAIAGMYIFYNGGF